MSDLVLLHIDEGVAHVTLNRPDALNTYTPAMVEQLMSVLARVRDDRTARAVVIGGSGPGFCAGADLKNLLPHLRPDGLAPEGQEAVRQLHACVRAVHELPLPVVAAVHGACAGGGVGLALACDIVLAAESAHFTAAFTAIGLTPDTGTSYLMVRAIGERRTRELLLTNRRVRAPEALAMGLVERVLPDNQLHATARELAAKLARGATGAIARTKVLLDDSIRRDMPGQLAAEVDNILACMRSGELHEGVAAFVEKRAPRFGERES